MKDKDQRLLWEAYMTEKKADKDYDGDGEVESAEDEYKGSKDKAIKKAMNEESAEFTDEQKEKGKKSQFKQMKADLDEEEKEVQEEDAGLSIEVGEEEIQDAIRNLTGPEQDDGDWELAVKQILSGIADRVIYHAKIGNGGVISDPDLADRWDFKTGVKDAIDDLLDAQSYSDISAGFKKAFHRANQDEQAGRFDFNRMMTPDNDAGDARVSDDRLQDMPPREPGA